MSDTNFDPGDSMQGIAVVGLAARFAGAGTVAELWRNLRDGVEAVSFFTAEELAAAGVDPDRLADPRYVRAKGVLRDADLFDAAFFGFTPREAEVMDPQHRVFLECAWEALEDAGCDPRRFDGRVGVYGGSGASSYLISNLLPQRELMEKMGVLQLLLLNDRDFLTTRVSHKLGLKGPSVAVQTACSTSLVAIHMACQSLLLGECDLALAGGVSISAPLVSGYLHQEGGVMSPDGHCRAFDASAAGAVEGNGCGVVALKRLADALAAGDVIHAVVRGSAVTNDGSEKVGFTAPGVEGQAAAISEALLIAGVEPDTIGYVETHGSGTSLGDPIEMEALTQAFRAGTDRTGFCAIGSVKTNLGHCNAAAGVAGFVKTVLALSHETLPASLNFERPNPRIDFAGSPFYVRAAGGPWQAGDTPRRAGVSSFGLGGTNAHVVLEEAPAAEPGDGLARPAQLLVLSARTPEALDAAADRLAGRLEEDQSLELADIAWTLQTGRREMEHRRIAVARDLVSAAAALRDPARTASGRSQDRPSVVFLFPGLGDQSVDMARELYEREAVFREQVDLCAGKLEPWLGRDLREVLFSSEPWSPAVKSSKPDLKALLRRDGGRPDDPAAAQLAQTVFAQPACFVVEYALARLLMSWGIQPDAMIGYSLGEYVAACLAEALSLDDALALVARRAKLIQELPPGAMLAVPLAEEEVRPLLSGELSLAATNGPHFCVVAGSPEAVAGLERELAGKGVSCIRLQTTHAFHSAMMEPVVAALTAMAGAVATRPPRIPYLSNVTGTWITERDLADPAYWARHMRGTVRFAEGLRELLAQSGRAFVEVGPGGTLATLVKQHPDTEAGLVAVPALGRAGEAGSDLESLLAAVGRLWTAGVEVDWKLFHGGERRRRVSLPTYPFERRRFWVDPPTSSALPAPAAAPSRTLDLDDWFWAPSWKLVPRVRLGAEETDEGWLIFLDQQGLGERMAARLRGEGRAVATVAAGSAFQAVGDAFTIDPGRRQDYDALIRHLGRVPGRILHLWGVTADEPSFDEAWTAGLLSLVFLEQAITAAGAAEAEAPPVRIAMVANGLHDLGGGLVQPGKATVLGAVKVVHQESARLACGSIEIDLPPAGSPSEELLVAQLLAEAAGPAGEAVEPVVAFHGGQRWVRAFEPVRLTGGPMASRLVTGGVYLIAGDAHGPGIALAGHLVQSLGARVALALPELPQLPDGAPGADRLLLLQADPGDAAALRGALASTRAVFGPVRGVFHAVGAFAGGLIQLKTPEGLRAAIDPVVHGALALLAAAENEPKPPEFVALFSSTFAVAGGLGQLEIAAAGAFLDALALRRSAEGGPFTAAIHWDPYQWDGWLAASAGALLPAAELQQSLEAYKVAPERSGEALRRLLASPLPRAIVSARDLPGLIAETDAVTAEVFLAQMGGAHRGGAKAQRPGLSTPYVAPRDEAEESLVAIWQELFGIEPIGVEDSFLEMGGHSLLAIQTVTQIGKAFDVDLPVTALFETPTIAGLAREIARLRGDETPEDLEDLLALVEALSPEEAAQRLGSRPAAPASPPPVASVSGPSGAGDWPLSFDQERLLRLHAEAPEMVSWNVDAGSRILGPLDVPALLAAFETVARRHAAWRATFPLVGGRRVQRVAPRLDPDGALIDLTALPLEAREPEAHRALFERTRAVFDLEAGPLVRVTLARLSEREHLCQITVHHLVTDWITFQVCWREVLAFYEASRTGRVATLPPLPAQYPDFVVWEREWLRDEVLEEHAGFWRRELEGFPLALELPADRPRPPVQSQRGGLYRVNAGAQRSDRLRTLARREGATMFMGVLAVLNALLHRFSGQEKLVVGSNSANRARPELESVFGLFLTQIPFATDLTGDPTFRELLGRVRRSALSAYAHQSFPFSKLLEALRPAPDPSRSPVMQVVLLVLEGQSHLRTADLEFQALPLFDGNSRWDLMFGLYDYPDVGLAGPLEYNADIFEAATVGRLLDLFYLLIDEVTENPDRRLSELPAFGEMLMPEEVGVGVGGLA
jgi:iturin family lipopeptide synthetase A